MNSMISHSPDETLAYAAKLATRLSPGDVIALSGDLGAGKTIFARGLAMALGVKSPISSPTYTIQHSYRGSAWEIHHIDLYRLTSPDDVDMLDLRDCWQGNAITIIEWPDRAENLLPQRTWHIRISPGHNKEQRIIEVVPPTLDTLHTNGIQSKENKGKG